MQKNFWINCLTPRLYCNVLEESERKFPGVWKKNRPILYQQCSLFCWTKFFWLFFSCSCFLSVSEFELFVWCENKIRSLFFFKKNDTAKQRDNPSFAWLGVVHKRGHGLRVARAWRFYDDMTETCSQKAWQLIRRVKIAWRNLWTTPDLFFRKGNSCDLSCRRCIC